MALGLLAVLLRLLYWLQYVALPAGRVPVGADVVEYDRWARQILSGELLWTELPIHAPLYAYWLAGAYALTGVSLPWVRLLQLGLDLVGLVCVVAALWRLVNRRAAFLAALFWALYQPLIYYSAELLSESLAVTLMAGMLLCWALAHRPGGRGPLRFWPLGAGAFLGGLAAITHPLTLAISVPFAGWSLWCLRRQYRARRLTVSAAALGGLLVLPVLPVTWRHAQVSGELVLIQAHSGLNLYIGNNPDADGTCNVRPGPAYEALVRRPYLAGARSEAEARRYFRGEVARFVRRQPLRAAWLVWRKAALTWNGADLPSGADLPIVQYQTPFMRLPLLRFGFVGPLALAAWSLRRCRRRHLAPFLWVPLCTTAALALLVTSGRYRLMMTPALLGAAALSCEGLWRCWRRHDRRTWLQALVLAVAGLALAYAVPAPSLPTAEGEAVVLLAEAAWRVRDLPAAEHLVRYGLAGEPGSAALHHLLGNILQEQGHLEEATAALRQAVASDPDRLAARVDLAIALAAGGATAEARELLAAAAARTDAGAEVWYNLGVLRERLGEPAAAADAYRQALERDRTHASARLNLGILLLRGGDEAAAEGELAAVLRLRPRDDKALAALGVLHAGRGDYARAAAFFARAVAANPGRDDLRQALERARVQAGLELPPGRAVQPDPAARPHPAKE